MKNPLLQRYAAMAFVLALATSTALAQLSMPAMQVYVMDMAKADNGKYTFKNAIWLSSTNPLGYNNQPYFIDTDQVLITTQQRDDSQTDVYLYDWSTLTVRNITNTEAQSEFSPMLRPDAATQFTTVNIEADGKTQRLWEYPLDPDDGEGRVLADEVTDVGYYQWIDNHRMAIFTVAEPAYLEIVDVSTQLKIRYASDIGRCIKRFTNGDLAYIQHTPDGSFIKRMDIANLDIRTVAPVLKGSEDFELLEDDTILMAQGDQLYKFQPLLDETWERIGDFSNFRLSKITRLAAYKGKLAIVGLPAE